MSATGALHPNGSFSAALGRLQRKEVDALLQYASMTPTRWNNFRFSFPISVENVVALVRRSSQITIRFDNLNANIEASVYALTLFAFGILLIVFLAQERHM